MDSEVQTNEFETQAFNSIWIKEEKCSSDIDELSDEQNTSNIHIKQELDSLTDTGDIDAPLLKSILIKGEKSSDSEVKDRKIFHEEISIKEETFGFGECDSNAEKKLMKNLENEVNMTGNCSRNENLIKNLKCAECPYITANKTSLRLHVRTHTGEKPYKCAECQYCALRKSHLVRHLKTHSGEKPFKCTICPYSASQNSTLIKHFRTHTGEKPFKCTECSYSASEKSTLVEHVRTHTGEKPFTCTQCSYSASFKSSLTRHLRMHSGEKPFKCTVCPYSASERSRVLEHFRIHSGERPFKCSQCPYSAKDRRCLKKHLKLHTVAIAPIDPLKPVIEPDSVIQF